MFRSLAVFLAVVLARPSGAETLQSLDAALRAVFPQAFSFTSQTVELSVEARSAVDAAMGRRSWDGVTQFLTALDAQGGYLGCAFVEEELGKHQPIRFLVALNGRDEVAGVELLVYREAQGLEIRSRRFRAQFQGRRQGDDLRVGSGVDAVSGATISSKTIAFGVRKALHLRAQMPPFNQAGTAPAAPQKGNPR